MLTFSHGNRIEALAERLTINLSGQPLKDPLEPEIMVVQNHGMARWLSLFIAGREGIAANLEFEFPSGRIWSLLRLMDPEIPEFLPSDRDPMIWSLMEVLDKSIEEPGFSLLERYIQAESPEAETYRKWKLCSRIADVFDQYLVYRPDLLLKWEDGNFQTGEKSEQWQTALWRELIANWKKNKDKTKYLHRAALQQKLMEAIDKNKFKKEDLPPRISIFGVSTMPPVFIRILIKLSKLIDVHFYWLSPVKKREITDNNHPLVVSFGKEGKEFLEVFDDYVQKEQIDSPKQFKETNLYSKEEADKNLLHILQADILESGTNIRYPVSGIRHPASSIRIHSCHSALREVEVLKDQLLALFEEDENLSPDEVLIMTPDIETYAPFIESVFGSDGDYLPDIPYSIADRSVRTSQPTVGIFLKIMEIIESRFKVTEVLDLFDSPAIKSRFNITDNDIITIEQWIKDTRIRWGINGKFKKKYDLPDSDSFTWQAGLKRMLLGYSSEWKGELFNGIFPYEEIEGTENAELLGRLAAFLNKLFKFYGLTRESRSPGDWSKLLMEILDAFIPGQHEFYPDFLQIQNQIEKLSKAAGEAGIKVPFRVIRSYLGERLEEQSSTGGFLGQGVTFSELVPMRSIPFKVIGMIGMNDGVFPRIKIPVEFDLISRNPRPGDRSKKNDDRYLFLENLLSARDCLYISSTGQSNREDTEIPPSVVVREFIDFISENYGINIGELVTKHRLQAFSSSYFDGQNKKLFSYSNDQMEVSRQLISGNEQLFEFFQNPLKTPEEDWRNVSIGDLIAFFQNPARFLLQNRLGLYLREEEIIEEDREPFALGGLDGYKLGQDLLDRFIDEYALETFKPIADAIDILPGGWTGNEAFQKKMKEVRDYGHELRNFLRQNKMEPIEVDLEFGDFSLTGRLNQIYSEEQLLHRFGRRRAKDLIDLWIKHLVFQLVKSKEHSGSSILLTKDEKEAVGIYRLSPFSDARQILEQLLKWYWQGLSDRFYFFPECSLAYAHEMIRENQNHEKSLSAALKQWQDYITDFKEGDDPYNKLLFDTGNPLEHKDFSKISILFFTPVFNTLE